MYGQKSITDSYASAELFSGDLERLIDKILGVDDMVTDDYTSHVYDSQDQMKGAIDEEIAANNDLEGDRDTIHKVGTQSEIGSTLREHLQEMQGDLDSSIADLAEARDSTAYAFRTAARQEAKAKTAETR